MKTYQIGQYLLGITWYVLSTSQIGQLFLGTSWYVSKTSQFGQSHLGTSWCDPMMSVLLLSLLLTLFTVKKNYSYYTKK